MHSEVVLMNGIKSLLTTFHCYSLARSVICPPCDSYDFLILARIWLYYPSLPEWSLPTKNTIRIVFSLLHSIHSTISAYSRIFRHINTFFLWSTMREERNLIYYVFSYYQVLDVMVVSSDEFISTAVHSTSRWKDDPRWLFSSFSSLFLCSAHLILH